MKTSGKPAVLIQMDLFKAVLKTKMYSIAAFSPSDPASISVIFNFL